MNDKLKPIPHIHDDDWPELLARANEEGWTQLCVCPVGFFSDQGLTKHLEELGFAPSTHVYRGRISVGAIPQLPDTLRSLAIPGNEIGDPGAEAVARHLTNLTTLDISYNKIGETGAEAVARHLTNLTTLYISSNKIGETGAEALARHLTNLTTLDISLNQIGETGAEAVARHLTNLTTLYISSNQIGETGAEAVARHLTNLTTLYISSNQIGETGAEAVARHLTNLTTLYISLNKIGETGAEAVARHLTNLTTLDISRNQIGETGAEAVARHLTNLTTLYISYNKIGDPGAEAVARHLTNLTTLDISYNKIGETGAATVARHLTNLTKLNISLNQIGETGAEAVARHLTNLTTLDISENEIGDPGAATVARHLTNLTTLYISMNQIGDPGAEAVARHLTNLTTLDISYNKIGETGAEAVARHLTNLTTLYISLNKIGETGAEAVARHLTNLTTLDISRNQIGDTGAEAVARHLTNLTTLYISSNQIGDTGAEAVARHLTNLTTLYISYNKIGDPGAEAVARHLTNLTTLDISRNQIGDTGAEAVARHLTNLTTLDISYNKIGDTGAEAVARHLTNLTTLDISSNKIGETGAEAVARHLTNLTTLDISLNKIGETGAATVARHLTNLTKLNISLNQIGETGAEAVARHLTNLTTLDISSNKIGDPGAATVARHLTNLTTLYISLNQIGDPGAEAVARHLTNLTTLDISRNQIGETGAEAVARHLTNLTQLYISDNDCSAPDDIIRGGDARKIREYYASIARGGAQRVDSFKLLIVGQGEVGKSHLRENLARLNQGTDPDFYDEQLDRTHDIDIQSLPLKLDDGPIDARVWDFGGQQFLHASHRFFLSGQRCLYLIAIDATRRPDGDDQSNQLSYWVRMVQQYGRDLSGNAAPLMIVLTQCDRGEEAKDEQDELFVNREANRAAVQKLVDAEKLPQENFIDGIGWHTFRKVDENEDSKRIWQRHQSALQQLLTRICELVPRIPGMQTKLGPEYFAMRDWIRDTFDVDPSSVNDPAIAETIKKFDHKKNHAFRQLCDEKEISPENLSSYLGIMHNAGMVHWLGDREDIETDLGREHLRAHVFNPAWIKSPAYELIRSQDRSDWKGWMSTKKLYECLRAPSDPVASERLYKRLHFSEEDRDHVLDLMKACRVAFPVKAGPTPDGLIFPDHLDANTGPPIQLIGDDVLRWRLETTFLPEHVFLRFIAKHHQEVAGNRDLFRNEILLPSEAKGQKLQVLLRTDLSPGFEKLPGIDLTVQGGDERCRVRVADRFLDELNALMRDEGLQVFTEWDVKNRTPESLEWDESCEVSYQELQSNPERLRDLERRVPKFSKDATVWISSADLTNCVVPEKGDKSKFRTLRSGAAKSDDEKFGVDKKNQIWRKDGNHVYYLRSHIHKEFKPHLLRGD